MPSIVSFHRNVGHAAILIILFSIFSLGYPCLSIHPPTFRDHSANPDGFQYHFSAPVCLSDFLQKILKHYKVIYKIPYSLYNFWRYPLSSFILDISSDRSSFINLVLVKNCVDIELGS